MIILAGVNHKTAELSLREKFHFPKEEIPNQLQILREKPGVREALILSTCNRVEVFTEMECYQEGIHYLQDFLTFKQPIDQNIWTKIFYVRKDMQAIHHLFRVTSSLDSMVIGEPQILNQVKEAFRLAMEAGTTGPILNRCFHRAFHVAKRVRTETGIAKHALSLSSIAVKLAGKIFDPLHEHQILLIGAGEMIQDTARRFVEAGVKDILVTNRTIENASKIAGEFQGTTFFFEKIPAYLPLADVVICCTSSKDPILTHSMMDRAIKIRKQKPIFIVDLSVPRNVDKKIQEIDDVFLYDIDDFKTISEDNYKRRQGEIQLAEKIILDEGDKFAQRIQLKEVDPLIISLHKKADQIAKNELQKTVKKLPDLSKDQEQALEVLTQSIVRKILHDPISALKTHTQKAPQDQKFSQFIRKIFRL